MSFLLTLAALASPLRPGEAMPDRHWDVEALDLALRIDPGAGSVEGTATHTVVPLGRRDGHLRLNQVALDVREVKVDGAVVEGWRLGPETLDIPMPELGVRHVVAVTYAATPQNGLHFRGPPEDAWVEVWSQGQEEENRYWFPSWDFPNDTFAYTASITAPADLVALSNGERVDRTEHDGLATTRYRLDGPIPAYLVAIAVGPYAVWEAPGPVPLEFIDGKGVPEAEVRAALATTADAMGFIAERLDEPFPWPVYRQVFVQRFLYGGMENPSLVVLADAIRQPTDGPWGGFTEQAVVHEVAHQWFGDRLVSYGWRDLWLSEAFATFYAAQWQRELHGEAFFATDVYDWQQKAYDPTEALAPDKIETELLDYVFTMYARGGVALHGLRTWLGPDVFDRAVAAYVEAHKGELVETADFRRALEDASGRHLGWWFAAYVEGTRFPTATTRWHWENGVLTVEIEQTTEGDPLEAPVDVEIGTSTGTREVSAWLGGGTTRVVLDTVAAPDWVAVDPQGAVIGTFIHEQDPAAWVAQARHSGHPYARLVAMDHLRKGEGGDDAIEALDEVLDDDDLPVPFRAHAVDVLKEIAAPKAVDELVAGLDDPAPYIRLACAHALADVPISDATAARLVEAWERDPESRVRAAALDGLRGQDAGAALKLARRRLGRPVDRFETKAAVEVIASEGDGADLGRVLPLTAPGTEWFLRFTALYALSDLVEASADDDDVRAKASRRIETFLADRDIRLRYTAVALLGQVGDDASAPALVAFASTCEVPALAQAARDAAAAIRTRGPVAEEEPEPTDVERLEERLKALEDRLDRLEEWRF